MKSWLNHSYRDTTIALAGVLQAIFLIKQLAQTGKIDSATLETSIYSIFQTHPEKISDVYGNLQNIRPGLETLVQLFSEPPQKNKDVMRHIMSLIHIQKKITYAKQTRETLTQRIHQAKKQVEYFSLSHPTVISTLADIYMQTISKFHFRIMVLGNTRSLSSPDTIEKIRALLLAGIRSVALWRQMGGSRLQLLFFRHKIKTAAQDLLSQLSHSENYKKETV